MTAAPLAPAAPAAVRPEAVQALLWRWLAARLDAAARQWLADGVEALRRDRRDFALYQAFSLVPRKIGKTPLALAEADEREADALRRRWQPSLLTLADAARLFLLLATAADAETLHRRVEALATTADVAELVLLYRGLPVYAEPGRYRQRAAEGVRSNMVVVFEAVAHHNPYPAEQLAEPAWNQLVLKALFVGAALAPVVGLDERANEALARMMLDYAHERWAANRPISPELWRCVGPFARGAALTAFERLLAQGSAAERAAGVLALCRSNDPAATALAARHPELRAAAQAGTLDWDAVARLS